MSRPLLSLCVLPLLASPLRALDANNNGQSDLWEMTYDFAGMPAGDDFDGDGWSNVEEAAAGTDPRSPWSFPAWRARRDGDRLSLTWEGVPGKRYQLLGGPSLEVDGWEPLGAPLAGEAHPMDAEVTLTGESRLFFRLEIGDQDSDGDGFADYEESLVGFDPATDQTGRFAQLDSARITAGLAAANQISVSVYDDTCQEGWSDPAVFVLRRIGGLQPLEVNFALGGTAQVGADYTPSLAGGVARFRPGQHEVFIEIAPLDDAEAEADESVTLEALPGSGYALGAATASVTVKDRVSGMPSAKEAARFLIQAAFGPDQDEAGDADQIPENVEALMAQGFEAWIEEQFARPVGLLQPYVQWEAEHPELEIYNDPKMNAWWGRAMGLPRLRPDAAGEQEPDPLRQRIGLALSEIFVVSDRMEDLAVEPGGMANYYDMLLGHAFGNYRDLLIDVSLHPCMGMYLSHLGNRKPDPVAKTHPDENYAREVMQLFSIGLWMLNPDGTRQLDAEGQPIPTYDNDDITEFARVFTGLAFGGANQNFGLWPRDFTVPMGAWDAEHDLAPKSLLLGAATPARTASAGNAGTATLADVNAAIDNLFNHPNTGPFIGRLLIQRLVSSNPSPAYVGRVAAAFADNGSGVRGDMKAVVRAILLDPEARSAAMRENPAHGKLREPFLKCVNLARAFNAASQSGWYYLDAFTLDHVQEPLKSPSVFNFFLPAYSPPGELAQSGLAAPELQIVNATSIMTSSNYFWNAITGELHRWGTGRSEYATRLNLEQEMLLNVPAAYVSDPSPPVPGLDPDPLIRRLDLALTGGTLRPQTCQVIHEALARIGPGSAWEWPKQRLKLAIYLIVNSPEFAVLR